MCERRLSKASNRFESDSNCLNVSLALCIFTDCSTSGNGGSVFIKKAIPVTLKGIEIHRSVSQGYGGGVMIESDGAIATRLCFTQNAAFGDYPGLDNNHFHAAFFRGLTGSNPTSISNTACYRCPADYVNGDTTLGMHYHNLQANDINITHSHLRSEMFNKNYGSSPFTNRRFNMASCLSTYILIAGVTGTPTYEDVNICQNNESSLNGELISSKNKIILKNAVIAFNNHRTFTSSSQIKLEACYFCSNSFTSTGLSSCPPTLTLTPVPPFGCVGTRIFSNTRKLDASISLVVLFAHVAIIQASGGTLVV